MNKIVGAASLVTGLALASASYAQTHHTANTAGGTVDFLHNGEANACGLIKGVWYYAPQNSPQAAGLRGYFFSGKPLKYFEYDPADTTKCHGSNAAFRIYDEDGEQEQ